MSAASRTGAFKRFATYIDRSMDTSAETRYKSTFKDSRGIVLLQPIFLYHVIIESDIMIACPFKTAHRIGNGGESTLVNSLILCYGSDSSSL